MFSSLREEKKLWRRGYKRVACLDEAGRGPLAGPVTAAVAMVCKFPISNFQFPNIKDSKQLSPQKREKFYKLITTNPNIKWGIGIVSEKVIDKINILEATKLAMKKAVRNLKMKNEKLKINYLILDGKMEIDLPFPQRSIIKADEKVFSCAAASILAKVTRDRIMVRYHKKYPKYRFNLHKGYPTRLHRRLLKKYGSCKIHRKSFNPVRACKSDQVMIL